MFLSEPNILEFDVNESAIYISDQTAFDFSETASRMGDIAENASLTSLSPAEFAGHTYFWCVYDKLEVEPGTEGLFDLESQSIKMYQTMF